MEDLVNAEILADEDVRVTVMPKDDADAAGPSPSSKRSTATRCGSCRPGPESLELCGGTHVARLGQIGPVEIVSEGSIGSNLRRIEATTGTATLARLRQAERQISDASALLRARPDELTTAVQRKLDDLKELDGRLRAAEQAALVGQARSLAATAVDGWLVARVDGLGPDQLRQLANQVRQIGGLHTVVLGGSPDGSSAALVALAGQGRSAQRPGVDLRGGPHRRRRGRWQEPRAGHGRRQGRQPPGRGPRSDPGPARRVIPATGRVLGVDLGSRRIGVAVTDSGQRVATGVTTLHRRPGPGDGSSGSGRAGRGLRARSAWWSACRSPFRGELGPAARGGP